MEGTPLLPKMPPAPRPPARKFVTGVGLLLLVVLVRHSDEPSDVCMLTRR